MVIERTFLDSLSEDDLAAMFTVGTKKKYRKGDVLFVEGQPATDVLIILEGTLKLTKASPDGDPIVLELRGRGELIGELAALDNAGRSASASAIDNVVVLSLDKDVFAEMERTRPSISQTVRDTLVRRVRESSQRQHEQSALDSFGLLCSRLVELCERFGVQTERGWEIKSPLSQQELAGWICVSRDAVVRSLTKARDLGWIDTRRREYTIFDLEALRRAAKGQGG